MTSRVDLECRLLVCVVSRDFSSLGDIFLVIWAGCDRMGRIMDRNSGEENAIPLLEISGQAPIIIKAQNHQPSSCPNIHKDESCVLVVGTTGTGKTSTVNIYTGSHLKVGEGAQAVTGTTVTVRDSLHPGHPSWIDNPGWADTEGRSDAGVFKELLRHMQNNKIYKVKAVVWCVMPQPRMDAILQAQADFIDMFTVEKDKGRIWNNVVIICKGKLSKNQAEDCQGARMAAKKAYIHANPVSLGYEFVSDDVLEGTTEKLRKETLRMLTDNEIRNELEEVFSKLPECVQVVFANQQCQACGQTGDPRLMEDQCHRDKKAGHTGTLSQRFSKVAVGVAAGVGAVGVVGLATTAALIPAELVLLALPVVIGPGAVMGSHRFFNTASTHPAPCGGVKITVCGPAVVLKSWLKGAVLTSVTSVARYGDNRNLVF